MHQQPREASLDLASQLDIQVARHLGGQPGLDTHLGGPEVNRLGHAAQNLLVGEHVALLGAKIAAEGAKTTVLDAHIGEVDVAVDHVGHPLAHLAFTEPIGHGLHGPKVGAYSAGQRQGLGQRKLVTVQSPTQSLIHFGGKGFTLQQGRYAPQPAAAAREEPDAPRKDILHRREDGV